LFNNSSSGRFKNCIGRVNLRQKTTETKKNMEVKGTLETTDTVCSAICDKRNPGNEALKHCTAL
jgi:hypothetical protein